MTLALTDDYLHWLADRFVERHRRREEEMGKHSRPEDTDFLRHQGYKCEGCGGFWAALEPDGGDRPEEIPCLATEGCEGPVVALYPVDEPPPDWIPVIIQGGKL